MPKLCAEVDRPCTQKLFKFQLHNSVTSNLITRSFLTGDSFIHTHHYSTHFMNSTCIQLGLFLEVREELKSDACISDTAHPQGLSTNQIHVGLKPLSFIMSIQQICWLIKFQNEGEEGESQNRALIFPSHLSGSCIKRKFSQFLLLQSLNSTCLG